MLPVLTIIIMFYQVVFWLNTIFKLINYNYFSKQFIHIIFFAAFIIYYLLIKLCAIM